MKFYSKYKFYLAFTAILLGSCNKFLDVKPKGQVIPETLNDYLALMSDPLRVTATSANQLYSTDEIFLPEEFRASANSYLGKAAVRAYDFDILYDTGEDDPDWNNAYRTLYVCNSVLAGLSTNTESDVTKRHQVEGEARVHRAYTYLMLVNEYATHYNSATAATDAGVPLPVKPDINALPARASVKDVYTLIEEDLTQATNLLADKSTYTYRPSKAAAFGMLARMYLYMGNWQKAFEAADKALQLNSFSYDYNTFSWSVPATKKGLLGFPSSSVDIKDIVYLKYGRNAGGAYQFNFLIAQSQAALYTTGDLRNEFGTTTLGYYGETLPMPGVLETGAIYNYNRIGITNGELLLTRAEAQARLGNTPEALNDLNALRKMRFRTADYKALTAETPAQALDLVLNDRRIELAFIGLRLFDIKRLNLEGRNISVQHGDKILKPGDPRFILPISQKVLDLNPNIKQNPR
ncbi:RagB/SusD family nutrient uptake outer membrane protein [Chitinophaga silvatica]|uniref:RagB/SusD family nutrient uptake outer membrane protein n=1 Tax=Chitinophaga silvatica TaxID=2282649 RepID=A0A3E1Y918_9BACT|nr:RagB/SusD family nutrient uptake outer membrane protein [Chitinophaga silvatica]RFS21902.1 RagB/SusD family nutrient uptake outer membrane protein [Chitinophaga silvatica]